MHNVIHNFLFCGLRQISCLASNNAYFGSKRVFAFWKYQSNENHMLKLISKNTYKKLNSRLVITLHFTYIKLQWSSLVKHSWPSFATPESKSHDCWTSWKYINCCINKHQDGIHIAWRLQWHTIMLLNSNLNICVVR